jgi:hypothetical protein
VDQLELTYDGGVGTPSSMSRITSARPDTMTPVGRNQPLGGRLQLLVGRLVDGRQAEVVLEDLLHLGVVRHPALGHGELGHGP